MPTPRKTTTKKAAGGGEAPVPKAKRKAGEARRLGQEAPPTKGKPVRKEKPKVKAAGRAEVAVPTSGKAPTPRSHMVSKTAKTPKRPVVDPEFQKQIREALVRQRQQLLSVVRSTQAQMAERTGDLPDQSDQAAEGIGDELAVGLMAIEAAQLHDIEDAIRRIDDGTYGLCTDCEKPIPKKRLEILPFVRRCLNCEGAREHRIRTQATYSEEEES
jgi:RNA polymerase-binding protein DksA